MRRLAFSLLTLLLLAACAGAPQTTSRGSGGGVIVANGAYHAPPPGFPHFVDHSVGREEISIQAMSLVGVPYRWGGNTPDSGFDCSGLVHYVVLRAASVNLPRTTADMSGRGESIEPDEIAPGDLIFFNTTGRPHSHVGIYVGKLRFVNAPSTGGTVRLDYLTNPYWAKRFDGIRRVAAPTSTPAPFDAPSYQAAAPQTEREGVVTTAVPAASAASGYAGTAALSGTPSAVTRTATPAYAAAGPSQATRVEAASPMPSMTASQSELAPSTTTSANRATGAQADPFEPPPPRMSAAQLQARSAGAVAPALVPSQAQANAAYDTDTPSRGQPELPVQPTTAARAISRPDAIDAAADAFEPPPSASIAARQAQQAQQVQQQREAGGEVQLMRASTASHGVVAPTQTNDDPIARFANGNY
ncbi:C40 family peptidase [Paraburkholderia sp. ZP32-5]|uniref:C40 family peptidase n=1 Tax=Paraburkholderia sp. ZP32-5 TaxID=2883245 RepID=UPI001F178EA3|nr:C40 family peptidase [Paraburkholderia sp. ZP32-5]